MKILNRITPFIIAGIVLVALAFGLVLLAYMFVFGAIVGCVLFIVNWVRERFFIGKETEKKPKQQPGRIIDSNDWRKL